MAGAGEGGRGQVLDRERLLKVLRRRHEVRLVLLEAPAGFGRTTLLHQALAEGPARRADHDVLVTRSADGSFSVADAVRRAAEDHADDGGHVALLVDDAHQADDAGALADLVATLPERVHLVLSTRRGRVRGIARIVAMGDVVRLDGRDLAFAPDEVRARIGPDGPPVDDPEVAAWPALANLVASGADDLVVPYLREEVVDELDKRAVQVLAATAAIGGGGAPLVEAVLQAVGGDRSTRAELAGVPLLALSADGCWPHPLWLEATDDLLDAELRKLAVSWAVDDRLARRSPAEAGLLAAAGGDGTGLRRAVRAALATQPPLVPGSTLSDWLASDVLPADSPERAWLAGIVDAQSGADRSAIEQLEAVRAGFEHSGDAQCEARVMMQLGVLARKLDDVTVLQTLVARAERMEGDAGADLHALRSLARAVGAQLTGDSATAATILQQVPEQSLAGDWAAQHHMILATNLALCGRDDEAVAAFNRATGLGSSGSQAVAHDLLASTLWMAGRFDDALDAAQEAERLALEADLPVTVDLALASRACLLALADDDDADGHLEQLSRRDPADPEAVALTGIARAVLGVQRGDEDEALRHLGALPPPSLRPTRSKMWRAALELSLLPEAHEDWRARAKADRSLRRAFLAGVSGRVHRDEGTELPADALPFLPSCWWPGRHPTVHLRFLGGAAVERDRHAVEVPGWQRGRVRELALHLAVRRSVGRDGVAAALWPDHDGAAASRNLRVNLSHLLDVLDPDRERGQGSALVVDTAGRLHLAEVDWLRVDVVELERTAREVVSAADGDDVSGALAASRRLLRFADGPLLGGAAAGEWLDPIRRHLDELVLRAAGAGADLALDAGEATLALGLGRRMVSVDPWSERAHRLVIAAHLATGGLDAARRAVADTLQMLGRLGAAPAAETLELAHRAAWSPRPG